MSSKVIYRNSEWQLYDDGIIEACGERWRTKMGPPYWFDAKELATAGGYGSLGIMGHVGTKTWVSLGSLFDVCRNAVAIMNIPVDYDFESLVSVINNSKTRGEL